MKWLKYVAVVIALFVASAVMENWPAFDRWLVVALVCVFYFAYQTSQELDKTKARLFKLEDRIDGVEQ